MPSRSIPLRLVPVIVGRETSTSVLLGGLPLHDKFDSEADCVMGL